VTEEPDGLLHSVRARRDRRKRWLREGEPSLGLTAGALFFALLRWNTSLYMWGGSVAFALAIQAARIAAVGGLFALAALHGALPLLLTALGLLIARPIVLHCMARGEAWRVVKHE
jgi:N-ATPase, AtpR subunit